MRWQDLNAPAAPVTLQGCFLPGGAPPTQPSNGTFDLVRNINTLRVAGKFNTVIFTQDWHPANHVSFASTHSKQPLQVVELRYTKDGKLCDRHELFPAHSVPCSNNSDSNGISSTGSMAQAVKQRLARVGGQQQHQQSVAEHTVQQVLWPEHCVEHTRDAQLHPGLIIKPTDLLLRKGHQQQLDAYSAFHENGHVQSTGLTDALKRRGVKRVVVVGVALEYCVLFTALDAVEYGFDTIVVLDATAPVSREGAASAVEKLQQAGVHVVQQTWQGTPLVNTL